MSEKSNTANEIKPNFSIGYLILVLLKKLWRKIKMEQKTCKICKKPITAQEIKEAWGEEICLTCWSKRADEESKRINKGNQTKMWDDGM